MNHQALNILVADDEALMRGLLTSFLINECNHKAIKSQDGKEALREFKLHANDIDIVFLDIEMPKMDGLETLEKIRAINPDAYVVILGGAGYMENVKKAIAAGVNGFIVKPYNNNKILEAIENYKRARDGQ